jgi:hypothetical protein
MKGVKGVTVYHNRNARGEGQILVEDMPMGMMERRHDEYSIRTDPPSIPLFIRLAQSRTNRYRNLRTIKRKGKEVRTWD